MDVRRVDMVVLYGTKIRILKDIIDYDINISKL